MEGILSLKISFCAGSAFSATIVSSTLSTILIVVILRTLLSSFKARKKELTAYLHKYIFRSSNRKCSMRNVFLKLSQKSHENTSIGVSV